MDLGVSDDEISKILAFDENRDGKISSNEFIKTFRNMDLGVSEDEISKMLAFFDPKRTGTIGYITFSDRVTKTTSTPISKSDPQESVEERILTRVRLRVQEKN